MTLTTTAEYHQLIVEISDDDTTYTKIIGMKNATFDRNSNTESDEVPHSDDESLPDVVVKRVKSIEMSVSGDGVWASESHEEISDWWINGTQKYARVGFTNAASGDTEYYKAMAVIDKISNERRKGGIVSGSLDISFSGLISTTAAA